MAKYDQGGGCPCGLQKHCDCDRATAAELRANIPKLIADLDGSGYCSQDECGKIIVEDEDRCGYCKI